MAGDVQLTALQVHAAPLDYLVPAAAVIRVKSVKAEFRDNGAVGDWLPAVEFISDAKINGPTASDQGSKVTAGGSADASFFPGVKHVATSSSGLTNLPYAYTGSFTGHVLNNDTNFFFPDMALITDNASLYGIATSGGNQGLTISSVGHYLAFTTLICLSLGSTQTAHMGVKSALVNKGSFLYGTADFTIYGKCSFIEMWEVTPLDLADVIRFSVTNQSGAAQDVIGFRVVVQLDTNDPSFDPF